MIEKDSTFTNEQTLSSSDIYSILINKMVLKYESSLIKDSYMDVKQFTLMIEINKNPFFTLLKMRTIDFSMIIDNGDELLYFIQCISSNFQELSLDIDETRKNVLKMAVFNNKGLGKVLESIDMLFILIIEFYILCIRSIFYSKPTKDVEKYSIFVNHMKEKIEIYKKEMGLVDGWRNFQKNEKQVKFSENKSI